MTVANNFAFTEPARIPGKALNGRGHPPPSLCRCRHIFAYYLVSYIN
jgi:hypothetical protein